METEVILRLIILALQVFLNNADYNESSITTDMVFFREGERIVLTGEFKDIDKIILCDDEYINNCGYRNEQKIVLKGQTQILLEISTYPWSYGHPIWYHTVPSNGKGYRFIIGQLYDRVTPIEKGGY